MAVKCQRSRITYHVSRITFHALAAILFSIITFSNGSDSVALAQASPITAEVDRTILSTKEQLTLTVTVTGEFLDIPSPDLSQLNDFVVVESSTSTQVSIINGDLTTQGVFVYRLQPLREGGLVVSPISINIDGQIYQTNPIDIRVVAGSAPAAPTSAPPSTAPNTLQGQDFFVEADIDNPTPYLGQQITYTFKLYQAATFIGQPDYQPPSFTNFWSQTIVAQPTYNTSAGGRDYLVTEIRTALFPANLGPVTITPAKIVIPNFPYQDIVLETESITIDVQSLPVGAPADFKGAVGQFEISAGVSENEGKVNEPVTLIVEIKGAGNIEALVEPALPELPNWRAFESQAQSTVEVQGDTVYGTRRFERLIVPGQPGDYTIPPISFSYYDPQTDQYRTISTQPIPVIVQPGESEDLPPPIVAAGSEKQQVSLLAGDIRHIKPVPASLNSEESSLLDQPLYWSGWMLPALVVGGVWLWQHRRQYLLMNTAYARSQRAKRAAQKILIEAQRSGGDSYAAAHRALLGYLSDKLNRPTAGLTTDNLVALLKTTQLDPALIQRTQANLDQIDVGRFAPGRDAAVGSFMAETHKL
ncbi:MAG TPA: BatD family protein, partial [Anaerolineae bacterium]|nr:BatD family protein [Anaerolineae bacterium]